MPTLSPASQQTSTCADCGAVVVRVSEVCDVPGCTDAHWIHESLAAMVQCPGTAPHVQAVSDTPREVTA